MNKIVYILGAGSSRELRFYINHIDGGARTFKQEYIECSGPLSSGFFYDSYQLNSKLQSQLSILPPLKLYEPLSKHIIKYCEKKLLLPVNKNDLLSDKEKSIRVNIEDLFIEVEDELDRVLHSQPIKNKDEPGVKLLSEIVVIQMQLVEFIFDALSIVSNYCYSKNHAIFAKHIVKSNTSVVSFNWDILLDEALWETGSWDYRTGYGVDFFEVLQKSADNLGSPKTSHNSLLKPHGSLNWYHPFNDSKVGLVIPEPRHLRGGTLNRLRESEELNGEVCHSYLVPPGRKRKDFDKIWDQLKQVLSEADEIIAIGFGFNDKDRHVIDELKDINFKSNLKIKMINPSGNDLEEKYRDVFKTSEVSVLCESFTTYCENIEYYEKN